MGVTFPDGYSLITNKLNYAYYFSFIYDTYQQPKISYQFSFYIIDLATNSGWYDTIPK